MRCLPIFLLGLSMHLSANCPQPESTPLTYDVKKTGDWVFYNPQQPIIQIQVKNTASAPVGEQVRLEVMTDDYQPLYAFDQQTLVNPNDSALLSFSFNVPGPGFYRCVIQDSQQEIKRFNIGFEPENIVSMRDAQSDFIRFWDDAKAELASVAPEYQLTLIPDSCSSKRNFYVVKMRSLNGEEMSGYYLVPRKKGKYPAMINYMGYGSKPWAPSADDNGEMIDFVLSVRGQGMQEPVNTYGDWSTYNLDNRDDYYYRGAFMDLIRAIDFVASRPETDLRNIFAEGASQGGAFTLAACALDNRLAGGIPSIPFLSDYEDYFRIVNWPAQPVKNKQKELGLSDDELYTTLSYFDIKNLASLIQCPILMGVGLQDEVCPPHTNFSGYNNITSAKSYYIAPEAGHGMPSEPWWNMRNEFIRKYTRK